MEKKYDVGLVLEGGGLRGVYTAGVLDLFLERGFAAHFIVGVSAGACQAFSYISKQKGRSFKVSADYINDPRYLSFRSFITKGEIFGMDFMFNDIPQKLIPFDYETFNNTSQEFLIGATNCKTGSPEYFSNKDGHDMFMACRASSSLPILSKIVYLYGEPYLDGGISDPIPIKRAELRGFQKNIVVLTRDEGYYKKESKNAARIMREIYKEYPRIAEAYAERHKIYNDTLSYVEERKKNGAAFVIRPRKPVTVGRTEKNIMKLKAFYDEGYNEADELWPALEEWLNS